MPGSTVHPAATPRLHRQLVSLGLDATALLRGAGLDDAHLAGLTRPPRDRFLRAKAAAAAIVGEVRLGLHLGATTHLDDLDLFGAAIAHARTLRDAVRVGARYLPVWEGGAAAALEVRGDRVALVYDPGPTPDATAARVDGLQSTVFLARALVRLLPRAEPVLRLELMASPAPDLSPGAITGLRRATFAFDQPAWGLDLPASLLDAVLPGAHPAVERLLDEGLSAELERVAGAPDVVDQVRAHARRGLVEAWDLPHVARRMGMSPRALQLRLAAAGTTWSRLLDAARAEAACALLAETDLPLERIAARTGFSSLSAFSRFFRHHHGTPPGAWRAARRG